MQFNPADIQTIGIGLAAFLTILVAIFIFLSTRKERLGQAMGIMVACGAMWSLFGFLYEIVPGLDLARAMRVVSGMGIVWLSIALVNFSTVYLEERAPISRWGRNMRLFTIVGGALLSFILVGDLFGGRFIVGDLAGPSRQVLAPNAGPLMFVLIAFYILCIAISTVLLTRRVRASVDKSDRHQAEIISFGLIIGLTLGGTRFVPWYGFDSPLLVYMAAGATPLIAVAVFYSIKRYKLFNIELVVAQFLIFALWTFTFFRMLLDKTTATAIPDLGLFVAVLVLGIYLLRSIITEIRTQKDLAQLTIERVKSEFVTIAAHQLRTPLTAIRWAFSSLSPKEVENSFSEEQRRMIELGRGAADNMAFIVNDLLNVARVSNGAIPFSIEPGDIREVVRAGGNLFEEAAKKKNIHLTFDLPQSPLPAMFDRGNLAFAVENLIDNAVKYTPDGGFISVRAIRVGDKILIRVADTGIGISQEDRAQLFEKFHRGKSAALMFTDGSGLGLFIAKKIIEGHGGTLVLASKDGGGTEATISLPTHIS